jgi:oxygen-dependent protoporphyrinogen oxidase
MLLSHSPARLERVGEHWAVTDHTGGHSQFDIVVLAVPPKVAARLLTNIDVNVSQSFDQIEMNAVSVATLSVDSAELNTFPVGPGLLVSTSRTDVTAKALTHANAKWEWWDGVLPENRHIVRLSFGRSGQPALSPSLIASVVADDARALLGLTKPWAVREVVVTQWNSSLVRPSPGHAARVGMLTQQVEQISGLAVLSGALCGNGLAGVIELARRQSKRLQDQYPY